MSFEVRKVESISIHIIGEDIGYLYTALSKIYKEQNLCGFRKRLLTTDELDTLNLFITKMAEAGNTYESD
jgi:hypothetical protein